MLNPYQPLTNGTRYGYGGMAYLLTVAVWSLIAVTELVAGNKLPAPWEVLHAFGVLYESHDLVGATLASTSRIALASTITVVVGIPVGILMGASPRINATLGPLVDPFRSAPVVAILPILILWIGIGEELKITFLVLGSIVFLIPLVRDAVMNQPAEVFITLKDLGATNLEALRIGLLPMALPRIWDAVAVAVSVQWTYITVAEYVNADTGLGKMITHSKKWSAMDQVFAGILVIISLALITNLILVGLRRRLFAWERD